MTEKCSFNENNVANIMKDIISAVFETHQNNILHKDLKPENIILDDKFYMFIIKIKDWRVAIYLSNIKD